MKKTKKQNKKENNPIFWGMIALLIAIGLISFSAGYYSAHKLDQTKVWNDAINQCKDFLERQCLPINGGGPIFIPSENVELLITFNNTMKGLK